MSHPNQWRSQFRFKIRYSTVEDYVIQNLALWGQWLVKESKCSPYLVETWRTRKEGFAE